MLIETLKKLTLRWQLYMLAMVAAIMFAGVFQYVVQGISAVTIPFATSRPEAFVLDGVMRLAQGSPLYLSIQQAPTTLHVYNFFAYTIPALAAAPFNTTPETLLIVGRLLSLVTSLGLAVLLGVWAYRASTSCALSSFWAAACVALAPFYFHKTVLTEFFHLRPESPATLCSVAAILCLFTFPNRSRIIFVAAGFCFLAFLFKQSFIAASVAITLYFILRRLWREGILFVAIYGGAIAVFFAIMAIIFGQAYFENTLFVMGSDEVNFWIPLKIYSQYFFNNSYGLLLALPAALVLAIYRFRESALLVCYWVVAITWNFYSSGKIGSSPNHYAEFGAASIMLLGYALFAVAAKTPLLQFSKALVILPLLIQILVGTASGFAPYKSEINYDDAGVDLVPYLARYKNNKAKLILHEKIAIQLGNPVGYDWFLLDSLIRHDQYDPNVFAQRIDSGEFDTIVFSKRPYSSFEQDLYRVVANGPYHQVYNDQTVIEFQRM